MADRPSGPVKPPVIDLTARSGARSEGEPSAAETPPRSGWTWPDITATNGLLLAGAVVLGAILGAVLSYLLALALPWPSHEAQAPDLTADLTTQTERIDALSTEMAALQKTSDTTRASLDDTASRLDTGLSAVDKSLAELKAAIPAPAEPVDLTPLETELRTLKAQLEAIAAGAPGTDAGAIAQSLADLETGIGSLTTRLNGVDSTVSALRTDLDATRKTLADHISSALPNEVGPALKLPLILSGLESAFATGRPFQDEIDSLKSVLPDYAVPASLTAVAATGLSRPDELMARFEAAIPDILAAREHDSSDWVQNGIDWAKSLLALRPVDGGDADDPDAVVARLEAAMTRRDYAAAAALIGRLPAPMQQAAAPVGADISAHADAEALVAGLRARALASADTP